MLALPGMEKRRWGERDARPALSIPGPQANAGHDHPLAFYLAAAKTASVPGEGRAAAGPQPRFQSADYPGPTWPFIDAAKVGRTASLPGQLRLAVGPTATRLRLQTSRRLPPFCMREMLTARFTCVAERRQAQTLVGLPSISEPPKQGRRGPCMEQPLLQFSQTLHHSTCTSQSAIGLDEDLLLLDQQS